MIPSSPILLLLSSSSSRRVKHHSVSSVLFPFSVFPRNSDPSNAAEDADEAAWHKFSKVSALVYVLYEVTVERTFENLPPLWTHSCVQKRKKKRKRLFQKKKRAKPFRKRKGPKKKKQKNEKGQTALDSFMPFPPSGNCFSNSARCLQSAGKKKKKRAKLNCFAKLREMSASACARDTHTHTHTHRYVHIYVHVYICVYR